MTSLRLNIYETEVTTLLVELRHYLNKIFGK